MDEVVRGAHHVRPFHFGGMAGGSRFTGHGGGGRALADGNAGRGL